ncbi:MAG: DoxX family protein [Actinomycetota bacterium]
MRAASRWVLAGFMVFAGISHLVSADAFLGQVPTLLPFRTPIVWVSGVVEIGLGLALALTRGEWRRRTGWALALFLLLVFPGNLYQAIAGTDAFGLDTPAERWGRLVLQPMLILWALWCSGAWSRGRRRGATAA